MGYIENTFFLLHSRRSFRPVHRVPRQPKDRRQESPLRLLQKLCTPVSYRTHLHGSVRLRPILSHRDVAVSNKEIRAEVIFVEASGPNEALAL